MLRRMGLLGLAGVGALLSAYSPAQTTDEYLVKAGFVRNFIAFTEWPEQVSEPLPICVWGVSPITQSLRGYAGKSFGGHELQVLEPASLPELPACRVIFVAAGEANSLKRIVTEVRGQPVLVVAESRAGLEAGASINLLIENSHVAFAVNLAAARAAGLTLSSKMLRLATEVRE